MPVVALLILVVMAGCGATLLLASRTRAHPQPRRRRFRRRRTEPDPDDTYSTWQFADWAGRDPVLSPAVTSDDRPSYDNACRVEADASSSFDVERDGQFSFDSCASDSSDNSGSDGDSGSSD